MKDNESKLGDLDPKFIGDGSWSVIHTVSDNDRNLALWIYEIIYNKFLCLECRRHFQETFDSNPPNRNTNLFDWSYVAHLKANQHAGKRDFVPKEIIRSVYTNKTMDVTEKLIHGVCFFLLFIAYKAKPDRLLLTNSMKLIALLANNHPCKYIRDVLRKYSREVVYSYDDLKGLMYEIYEDLHSNARLNYKSEDEIREQYGNAEACDSCGGGAGMEENSYRDEM